MADSDVVLPQGNLIDVPTVTTAVGTVQRQRIAQGDAVDGSASQLVRRDGAAVVAELTLQDLLLRLLREIQLQNLQNFGTTATDLV